MVTRVDPTRGTPVASDVPAASTRTIETLVLYPYLKSDETALDRLSRHGSVTGIAQPGASA